jgi:hypothetical protein
MQTPTPRKHDIQVFIFSVRGYCDVCKKVIHSQKAVPLGALENVAFFNLDLVATEISYKALRDHECPGPDSTVYRSYDGVIEMSPRHDEAKKQT